MQLTGKKLRIGWFSFSCCEDSTVMFAELLNDHFELWRQALDIRHAKVLQTHNVLDELDVAFIEGAVASPEHEEKVKNIRAHSTTVVAIGACACTGMPSAQRNNFTPEQNEKIQFLFDQFPYGKTVKKLDDVIQVDEHVQGCPMVEASFLATLDKLLRQYDIVRDEA
jgi:coenzyme F420-reducing hydrogenase gamma subunit